MIDCIDEHELQRLLDGHLPTEDRALFLQQAEENPRHWRTIALAFVEEQTLRQELTGLLEDAPVDAKKSTRTCLANQTTRATQANPAQPQWFKWCAQAVALLVMLGAGVWIGGSSHWHARPELANSNSSQAVPSQAMREGASSAQQSRNASLVTSLRDHEAIMNRWLNPVFDQDAHSVFRDHGYQVAEEPVIIVVHGNQGEQYLVPHRNVTLISNQY